MTPPRLRSVLVVRAPARPARLARWWLGAAALSALALAGAAVVPLALDRIRPPEAEAAAAGAAIARARETRAAEWAGEALRVAEEAWHDATTEHRRQQLRFPSLRDYRDARIRWRLAEVLGLRAAMQAERERDSTGSAARAALERLERNHAQARALARRVKLGEPARRSLAQGSVRLEEARHLLDVGDYRGALEHAASSHQLIDAVLGRGVERTARFVDPDELARWRSWTLETIDWSRRTGRAALVLVKDRNKLTLYVGGRAMRSWHVDVGANAAERKLQRGDRATPEGKYRIVTRKSGAQTKYHKALLLDYPTAEDLRRFAAARRAGQVGPRATPGGLIEIHGEGGRGHDWTDGCPALSNRDMDELFARVEVGTPVTIVGGDGTGALAELHRELAGR